MTLTDLTARYDRAAPDWARRLRSLGYPAAYRGLFVAHAGNTPAGHAADIGCGTGDMALAFAATAPDLRSMTLVDAAPAMARIAEGRFPRSGAVPVTRINASLDGLRPARRFDTLLAGHLIEHCAAPATAMTRLAAHLTPGGRLYLVVNRPHWCQWLIWLRWRHRWHPTRRIEQWAAQAGLHLIARHRFAAGPPARTSLGLIFCKPNRQETSCS